MRAENFKVRNQLRNLSAYVLNKMFPGSQRNNTARDAKAFTEHSDFYQSTAIQQLGTAPMVGVNRAGE